MVVEVFAEEPGQQALKILLALADGPRHRLQRVEIALNLLFDHRGALACHLQQIAVRLLFLFFQDREQVPTAQHHHQRSCEHRGEDRF